MVDITKYYSSLTIKVTLKEVNNSNNNNNIIYSVSGNIGSFLFGICELNYFRIFARPNKYLLNFQVENYIDKIDINKTKNTVYAINIPVYFIIIFYIIFVIINRKERIMFYFVSNLFSTFEDYKECSLHFMFKHFGLSIVFIMYSICICLASELSINNESKNKLKAVSFEIVTTELGMYSSSTKSNEKIKKEEEEKEQEKENEDYGLKSIKFVDDLIPDETVNTNEVNTHLELKLMRISSIMLNDENTKKNKKDKKELNSKLNGSIKANSHTDSSMKKNKNNDLLRNILRIRSLFIEITMLYLLYIIMTIKRIRKIIILTCLFKTMKKTWTYNCQLTNMDLIYNFLYLLWLIVLLINGREIIRSECIFKYNIYIFYSLSIAITLGPSTNIIGDVFLKDRRIYKIMFEIITNMICYFILFILFSFDKVFYIARNEGNNPDNYFIFKRREYNSNFLIKVYKDEFEVKTKNEYIILKYIYLYRFCSKFFTINKKKINSIKRDL
ncbi:hypothetical protein H8356DRAFT_1728041 [Neocallimastix lanati (nom. inval.)]|nr:hypothetical protein H8356DRAFT_1728041 [Neocallimastix sp. JGI-2020a]